MTELNPERFKFWDTEVGKQAEQFQGMILNIHKHRYVAEGEGGFIATIVLVAGSMGDYAAYEGVGSPEWIKHHGTKLTFKQAQQCFMGLEEKRYRR